MPIARRCAFPAKARASFACLSRSSRLLTSGLQTRSYGRGAFSLRLLSIGSPGSGSSIRCEKSCSTTVSSARARLRGMNSTIPRSKQCWRPSGRRWTPRWKRFALKLMNLAIALGIIRQRTFSPTSQISAGPILTPGRNGLAMPNVVQAEASCS